jgi:hypothetical protein
LTGLVDGTNGRKNKNHELKAMTNILKLIERYRANVLFTKINVNNIVIDHDIKKIHYDAFINGYYTRPINQYAYAAQVAKNLHIIGEVCIVNDGDLLHSYGLIKQGNPYSTLTFPLINLSKNDMLEYAKKHKFNDILAATWSCWYPIVGKPCGFCQMCKDRII